MNLILTVCVLAAVAAETVPETAVETNAVKTATAEANAVETVTSETNAVETVTSETNAVANVTVETPSTARITSRTTYYDRKEGVAHFSGNVFVDDRDYQLHADSAFVFLGTGATNELNRIVALGNVALTNEARRAYGTKVSYYRQPGLVVLHGDAEMPAQVLEETPDGVRKVVGKKIKFWIGSEQVEVVESVITAPKRGNMGIDDLKRLGR